METKIAFRGSYRGRRAVPAEVVQAELARLATAEELAPSRILVEAEPEGAPLHPEFEWDDSEAGHKFRLIQARALIRAVVVVPANDGKSAISEESVYVHVPATKGEGRYVRLDQVTENRDDYEKALFEAQRDLDAAERRFHELRRLVEGRGDASEAMAIATQAFSTVREALAILKR